MDAAGEKCFVEEFHLRSPVEEFEEYGRAALEHLRNGDPKLDETTHREAIGLVLRKLGGGPLTGGGRFASRCEAPPAEPGPRVKGGRNGADRPCVPGGGR